MNSETRKNICEEMEIEYELYKEAIEKDDNISSRIHLARYNGMKFILRELDFNVTNTYENGECKIELSI